MIHRHDTRRVTENVGTRRHQQGGLFPDVGLLVADPQRLEHGVGRIEVRSHRTIEVPGRDPLGECRRLRLRPSVHPDQGGAQAAPRRVADDHPVELRSEGESSDRRRTVGTLGDQPAAGDLHGRRPQVRVLLRPPRVREGEVIRLVGGGHQLAIGSVEGGVRPLAADVAADHDIGPTLTERSPS